MTVGPLVRGRAHRLFRLWLVSRPLVWLPTLALYAGGLLLGPSALGAPALAGLLYFTFPFGILVYGLNDIADQDSDRRNGRKGLAQGAVVDRRETGLIVVAMVASVVPFLGYFLLAGLLPMALVVLFTVAFGYAYSMRPLRLKARPLLDSATAAVLYTSIFVGGYYADARWFTTPPPAAVLGILLCCAVAVHGITAALDHHVDRLMGDTTIAVFLGRRATVVLCACAYAVGFVLSSSLPVGAYLAFCCSVTALAALGPTQRTLHLLTWATVAPVPFLAAHLITAW